MPIPPLDFLLEVSLRTLQDLELNNRNQSAMLSRSLRKELEAWIEYEATAMMARWMIEKRDEMLREAKSLAEPKKVEFIESQKQKKLA